MFPDSGRRCGDPFGQGGAAASRPGELAWALVALTLAVAALFQPAQAHLWLRPRT
jgi:hypothetical protein